MPKDKEIPLLLPKKTKQNKTKTELKIRLPEKKALMIRKSKSAQTVLVSGGSQISVKLTLRGLGSVRRPVFEPMISTHLFCLVMIYIKKILKNN